MEENTLGGKGDFYHHFGKKIKIIGLYLQSSK